MKHNKFETLIRFEFALKFDVCFRGIHQCEKVQQLDRDHDGGRKVANGPVVKELEQIEQPVF